MNVGQISVCATKPHNFPNWEKTHLGMVSTPVIVVENTATPTPIPPPPTITSTPTHAKEMVIPSVLPPTQSPTVAPIKKTPSPTVGNESDNQNTATPIPPVTIVSVLKPARLLWLFIIGIIVFTMSYGIQVIIWYRLRR